MDTKKASVEYGIVQLTEDFPVLSIEHTTATVLFPLVGMLVGKFLDYLEKNSRRIGITHTRITTDPHFACRTFLMVVRGRIIDVEIPYDHIDGKDYCGMPARIILASDPNDLWIIEKLMSEFRKVARKQDVDVLKKEVLENIKEALRSNEKFYCSNIYQAIRGFYGSYELREFEDELYRERRASASA